MGPMNRGNKRVMISLGDTAKGLPQPVSHERKKIKLNQDKKNVSVPEISSPNAKLNQKSKRFYSFTPTDRLDENKPSSDPIDSSYTNTNTNTYKNKNKNINANTNTNMNLKTPAKQRTIALNPSSDDHVYWEYPVDNRRKTMISSSSPITIDRNSNYITPARRKNQVSVPFEDENDPVNSLAKKYNTKIENWSPRANSQSANRKLSRSHSNYEQTTPEKSNINSSIRSRSFKRSKSIYGLPSKKVPFPTPLTTAKPWLESGEFINKNYGSPLMKTNLLHQLESKSSRLLTDLEIYNQKTGKENISSLMDEIENSESNDQSIDDLSFYQQNETRINHINDNNKNEMDDISMLDPNCTTILPPSSPNLDRSSQKDSSQTQSDTTVKEMPKLSEKKNNSGESDFDDIFEDDEEYDFKQLDLIESEIQTQAPIKKIDIIDKDITQPKDTAPNSSSSYDFDDDLDDLSLDLNDLEADSMRTVTSVMSTNMNPPKIQNFVLPPRLPPPQKETIIKTNKNTKASCEIDDFDNETESDENQEDLDNFLDEFEKSQVIPKIRTANTPATRSSTRHSSIFKAETTSTTSRNSDKNKQQDLTTLAFRRRNLHRYQIINVKDDAAIIGNRTKPQKILNAKMSGALFKRIILRDSWCQLEISPKDVIHIVGDYDDNKASEIIVDDHQNLLVLHPDILIPVTTVSESFHCERRTVLKQRISLPSEVNKYIVYGTIIHEIIQGCLQLNSFSNNHMEAILGENLDSNLLNILLINETKDSVASFIRPKFPKFRDWAAKMFKLGTGTSAYSHSNVRVPVLGSNELSDLSINRVIDIEEEIWSPMFGLKGIIDVTVEAKVNNREIGNFLVPLEIKTGRTQNISHSAQVLLYTLLLFDRYDIETCFSLLYYSELEQTTQIPKMWHEIRSLIIGRNKIAKYFFVNGDRNLPDMLRAVGPCSAKSCYAISECMTYHKALEDGNAESSGIEEFNSITQNASKPYIEFFNKYDKLLSMEETTMGTFLKELWISTSEVREAAGRCIGNLVLQPTDDEADIPLVSRIDYTFIRNASSPITTLFTDTQINLLDHVHISDEEGHFALCNGFVKTITSQSITISTNKPLTQSIVRLPGYNSKDNQQFKGMLHVSQLKGSQINLKKIKDLPGITYRIDKQDEMQRMGIARYNIINYLLPDGDKMRSKLIIDKVPPRFGKKADYYELPKNHTFNDDQVKAFDMVMRSKDYSLLLGMPGTGKTTTIAQLVRMLVARNKSVLLTSYTHAAVDNILLKLKDDKLGIVRVGHFKNVHPLIQRFIPGRTEKTTPKNQQELEDIYYKPPIVGSTVMGIQHFLFNKRHFDYCIVDEASMITLPFCIGPLRFCDRFVLVGDPNQLTPLVKNPEAKSGGLDLSLFKMLADDHPEAVTNLSYQYRMCNDIVILANTLIYEGELKCGTEKVAEQNFKIPSIKKASQIYLQGETYLQEIDWMKYVLNEQSKVVFLDTDKLPGLEERKKDGYSNSVEAKIIKCLVETLFLCDVAPESIGVLSVYREQLKVLNEMLGQHKGLQIMTADKFQGTDKECVIISLVRSNDKHLVGDLLRDWRRLNVAITRAKSKLIIVGSKKTLETLEMLKTFLNVIKENDWLYQLPPNALELYKVLNLSPVLASPKGSRTLKSQKTNKQNSIDKKLVPRYRPSPESLLKKHPIIDNIMKESTN